MNAHTIETGIATPAQVAILIASIRNADDAWIADEKPTDEQILDSIRGAVSLPGVHVPGASELVDYSVDCIPGSAEWREEREEFEAYVAFLTEPASLTVEHEVEVIDADGDYLTAARSLDGTVTIRVAVDGGDTFTSVDLTPVQWAAVRAL